MTETTNADERYREDLEFEGWLIMMTQNIVFKNKNQGYKRNLKFRWPHVITIKR